MIRAAYGDHANTGGSNRTKVMQAIDRLRSAAAATQPAYSAAD